MNLDNFIVRPHEIEFVNLLTGELTDNGIIDPRRFYGSPTPTSAPPTPSSSPPMSTGCSTSWPRCDGE